MEIIELSGYFLEEKVCIATKHLIPELREKSGLSPENVILEEEALRHLISSYCREAGVRSLQKYLERIFRKVALQVFEAFGVNDKIAKGETHQVIISLANLEEYAGKARFLTERMYDDTPPGVVTGLAWSTMGKSLLVSRQAVLSFGSKQLCCDLSKVTKEHF